MADSASSRQVDGRRSILGNIASEIACNFLSTHRAVPIRQRNKLLSLFLWHYRAGPQSRADDDADQRLSSLPSLANSLCAVDSDSRLEVILFGGPTDALLGGLTLACWNFSSVTAAVAFTL